MNLMEIASIAMDECDDEEIEALVRRITQPVESEAEDGMMDGLKNMFKWNAPNRTSGAPKAKGEAAQAMATAQKPPEQQMFDITKHDKEKHPNGFHPENGDTCVYRDKMAEAMTAMGTLKPGSELAKILGDHAVNAGKDAAKQQRGKGKDPDLAKIQELNIKRKKLRGNRNSEEYKQAESELIKARDEYLSKKLGEAESEAVDKLTLLGLKEKFKDKIKRFCDAIRGKQKEAEASGDPDPIPEAVEVGVEKIEEQGLGIDREAESEKASVEAGGPDYAALRDEASAKKTEVDEAARNEAEAKNREATSKAVEAANQEAEKASSPEAQKQAIDDKFVKAVTNAEQKYGRGTTEYNKAVSSAKKKHDESIVALGGATTEGNSDKGEGGVEKKDGGEENAVGDPENTDKKVVNVEVQTSAESNGEEGTSLSDSELFDRRDVKELSKRAASALGKDSPLDGKREFLKNTTFKTWKGCIDSLSDDEVNELSTMMSSEWEAASRNDQEGLNAVHANTIKWLAERFNRDGLRKGTEEDKRNEDKEPEQKPQSNDGGESNGVGSDNPELNSVINDIKGEPEYSTRIDEMTKLPDGYVQLSDDTGATQVIKEGDKYYLMDQEGNKTGEALNADEAYALLHKNSDDKPAGQTPQDHAEVCKADPKSNCPYLNQNRTKLDPETREEVFGDNPLMSRAIRLRAATGRDIKMSEEQALALAETLKEMFGDANVELMWGHVAGRIEDPRKLDDPDAREQMARAAYEGMTEAERGKMIDPGTEEAEEGKRTEFEGIKRVDEATRRQMGTRNADGSIDITINGKEYVDVSDMPYFESLEAIARAGREGKEIIEAWDKMNGRWDAMKKAAAKNKVMKDNMTGLQEGLQATMFENMADAEIEKYTKLEGLTDRQKTDIAGYTKMYQEAKTTKKKMQALSALREYVDANGLSKENKRGTSKSQNIELRQPPRDVALPPKEILDPPNENKDNKEYGEQCRQALAAELLKFGSNARIPDGDAGVRVGPLATEIVFDPGADFNYAAMQNGNVLDNITHALKAKGRVDVVDLKDGSGLWAVRVTNPTRSYVSFSDIYDTDEWKNFAKDAEIPLMLGKDATTGKIVKADLAKLPHMIIGGATGQGKSVGLNTIINGVVMDKEPDEVQLILCDPKRTEFTGYRKDPHLAMPVLTNPKDIAEGVSKLREEMLRRMDLLGMDDDDAEAQQDNARSLSDYNKRVPKEERLARQVLVIDELAEATADASVGKKLTADLKSILALGRALGIHVICATQRSDVTAIPGDLKNNMPARVAYKTATGTDSRTILDEHGAEKLTGEGDFLFKDGRGNKTRGQGARISDEEISRIQNFFMTGTVETSPKRNQEASGGSTGGGSSSGNGSASNGGGGVSGSATQSSPAGTSSTAGTGVSSDAGTSTAPIGGNEPAEHIAPSNGGGHNAAVAQQPSAVQASQPQSQQNTQPTEQQPVEHNQEAQPAQTQSEQSEQHPSDSQSSQQTAEGQNTEPDFTEREKNILANLKAAPHSTPEETQKAMIDAMKELSDPDADLRTFNDVINSLSAEETSQLYDKFSNADIDEEHAQEFVDWLSSRFNKDGSRKVNDANKSEQPTQTTVTMQQSQQPQQSHQNAEETGGETKTVPANARVTELTENEEKRAKALSDADKASVENYTSTTKMNSAQQTNFDNLLNDDSGWGDEQ